MFKLCTYSVANHPKVGRCSSFLSNSFRLQAKEYFHVRVKLQSVSLLSVEVLILSRFSKSLQDLQWDWRESARDWEPDNGNIAFDFMQISEFYIVVTLPNAGPRHTSWRLNVYKQHCLSRRLVNRRKHECCRNRRTSPSKLQLGHLLSIRSIYVMIRDMA